MLDETDPAEATARVGARLRNAWVGRIPDARMEAMRALWTESDDAARSAMPGSILTAGAAARIAPSADHVGATPADLIASMLSAGHGRRGGALGRRGRGRPGRATAPGRCSRSARRGRSSATRLDAFVSADDSAGPSSAGRCWPRRWPGSAGSAPTRPPRAGFSPGARRSTGPGRSTRRRRSMQPGTVALLAGVGMQTGELARRAARTISSVSCARCAPSGIEYRSADDRRRGGGAAVTRDALDDRQLDRRLPRNDGGRSRRRAQHLARL